MFPQFFQFVDRYADALVSFVSSQNVLAPLLLLFIEEAGVPIFIPGDVVLAYTGYKISLATITPTWFATLMALVAVICGASILFYVSRRWGDRFIHKFGRFVFLSPDSIERSQRMFEKYGVWAIIFGRHIPGMRIPLTVMAGSSGMKYRTFILCTITSTLLWILLYLNAGRRYGAHLNKAFHHYAGLTIGIFMILVLGSIALHVYGEVRAHHHRPLPK